MLTPKLASWKYAQRFRALCYAKNLGATWAIAFHDNTGQEFLINFGKTLPTFLVSEEVANKVLRNLDVVFQYLKLHQVPDARGLQPSMERLLGVSVTPSLEGMDPKEYTTLHWEDVPKMGRRTPIQECEFNDGTWGIVSNLPWGDFLVVFDPSDDPYMRTFFRTQGEALEAIDYLTWDSLDRMDSYFSAAPEADWLNIPPAQIDPKLRSQPLTDGEIQLDMEIAVSIGYDWLVRRTGEGKHCLCPRCQKRDEAALRRIQDRYDASSLPWDLFEDIQQARRWIRGDD
ncbi:MAG: hypothetical protein UY40_C0025G0011 [candidate division CPR1 bacterium GW2011_GWC1_49_13]|uniref:Uncharacterized protein n=1 Tax=candidate division CPR1 bacterium GW2011_GWC1_49_13 TaxID=1618342 RepID=A0A0G1XRR6_9BACT|nr:MAG: hypothetical protein UY40_C0025G0011 [candidate division CPR1 bacterium GW2011_GWC1_49_13]